MNDLRPAKKLGQLNQPNHIAGLKRQIQGEKNSHLGWKKQGARTNNIIYISYMFNNISNILIILIRIHYSRSFLKPHSWIFFHL